MRSQISQSRAANAAAKLHDRLIRPLLHDRRPPEYTARGVAVGLFVAFTPTVGVQIPIVFALWAMIRTLKREWRFNPIVASAWTLLTNFVTVPPLYYVFVQTGRVMLGRWEKLRGYDAFRGRLEQSDEPDESWLEGLWGQAAELFDTFGLPLIVGSLPWAIAISAASYWWTLRLVRRHRAIRLAKTGAAASLTGSTAEAPREIDRP